MDNEQKKYGRGNLFILIRFTLKAFLNGYIYKERKTIYSTQASRNLQEYPTDVFTIYYSDKGT